MQKAWFYEEYGPKEVLQQGAIPIPYPRADQLLVQVHAATLNPIDFKLRRNPLDPVDLPVVPGCDMAGVVWANGDGVLRFDVGDEVYGNIQNFKAEGKLKQLGSLAEFVVLEEELMAVKPKNVLFEEAASLPVAVQTAVEGFKTAGFQEGGSLFIVGGVGTSALQLAKQFYKASVVTATTSTGKEGAPVIDVTWPPSNPRAQHTSLTVSGKILEELRPYLESRRLKAVIDPTSSFPFSNVIDAFGHLETGRARGKVVISPVVSSSHHLDFCT
ncbi:UNVERIFIED_CONTAM: 2-methylene-furan-3-one reductase [Sesamum angustifolium]|uniref:2-methylene-furan-3-one reductase n=1 Tax=Sesamum angustifolium TaxID=2727405 RepID=A0AAW2RJE0_9LAMI